MSNLLCWIWPYLMGGLIAWLLAGWLARGGQSATTTVNELASSMPPRPTVPTAAPVVAAAGAAATAVVDRAAALRPIDIDVDAARAAGIELKGPDDLEIIEGVGPKIAELLNAAGIRRFRDLAVAVPADLQKILDQAGPHFRLAHPDTWPEQAMLAAHNHWRALKQLQDVLVGGVRK